MTKIFAAIIIAACAVILLVIGGSDLAKVAIEAVHSEDIGGDEEIEVDEDNRIHFYNYDAGAIGKKFNFGPDAFDELGNYAEPFEELLDRLDDKGLDDDKLPDPCLMAAVAFAMDDRLGTDFLARERAQYSLPSQIVNGAAENLTNEPEYRAEMLENIRQVLEDAEEVSIEEIGAYTSTMWMVPNEDHVNTYAEKRPTIAVENSNHNGGHALVITYDGRVLRLRLECGYQPMDVHWPTPSDPPGTTPPPPSTTRPPETTPPPPEETTPVTTTLAPKNTAEAVPVVTDPNNGGSKGGEADRTPTPEPTWPTTTTQTKAPEKTSPPATEAPAPTTQPQPSTQPPAPTTTRRNDKDYVVDQGTTKAPQKDVVGDTPDDAVVKTDPIVQETAPPGGGDFASRY